jgi:hypothetical protein
VGTAYVGVHTSDVTPTRLPPEITSLYKYCGGVDPASLLRVKHPWLPVLSVCFATACMAPTDELADPDETADLAEIERPLATTDLDDPLLDSLGDLAPVNAAAVALAPGCIARAPLAGHVAWFFFTRPDRPCKGTTPNVDLNAIDELTRLIDSVPAGGRIDGHIFSINVASVAAALLRAQNERLVDVRISINGAFQINNNPLKAAFFDKLNRKVYCHHSNNEACIGTADGAISHTKLFVFSTATAPDGVVASNVSWFGSANQTIDSGAELYNNTVTIYGDRSLYAALQGYLNDLFAQRRTADYYDPAGRGHILATSADVYVSPELQTDIVVNRLDDVTPASNCDVRVMQASIRDSRLVVVDRLITMKRGGCRILVVASTVEPRALAALKAAAIPVRRAKIHDKSFIVVGNFPSGVQHRVYTGSHNLSTSAAHRYDEIFVKLAPEPPTAHPVYDAYITHFNDAFNIGTPL